MQNSPNEEEMSLERSKSRWRRGNITSIKSSRPNQRSNVGQTEKDGNRKKREGNSEGLVWLLAGSAKYKKLVADEAHEEVSQASAIDLQANVVGFLWIAKNASQRERERYTECRKNQHMSEERERGSAQRTLTYCESKIILIKY